MHIGNRNFDVNNKTYIAGILNVTDDSFSDGGKYNKLESALFRCQEMIEEGADIIDIGGESTRPGYTPVSASEEMERVLHVLERIKSEFDIPVSLDTRKPKVANEGLKAGADIINNVEGLGTDYEMADVIAQSGAVVIMSHPGKGNYKNVVTEVVNEIEDLIKRALKADIDRERIIIDPGIGFGKDTRENLELIKNIDSIKALDVPIRRGVSRKSFIGNVLNLSVDERLEGTLAISAYACMKGIPFVRVHDVKANKRVIQMLEAIDECNKLF